MALLDDIISFLGTYTLPAVFVITAAFILFSIVMTLTARKSMQAAYWLILMLIGVGILFLLANSEVLFAFQISIYSGGIAVLLLFAVLLVEHDESLFDGQSIISDLGSQIAIVLILGLNLIYLPFRALTDKVYLDNTTDVLGDTSRTVSEGKALFYDYFAALWGTWGIVIPILSLLLLTGLLGSVKLVIREWELEELSDAMKIRYMEEPTE